MINSNEINSIVMDKVVETAQAAINAKAAESDWNRWIKAIIKAADEIANNPRWSFDAGKLTLLSRKSNKIYEVANDGHHEGCPAYDNHQPCWHRAARRLLDLYNLAMALPILNVREPEAARQSHAPAIKDGAAKAFLDANAQDALQRLEGLLADSQPGLASSHIARESVAKELPSAVAEAYRRPSNSLGETFAGYQI